jgi:hypothetical protein
VRPGNRANQPQSAVAELPYRTVDSGKAWAYSLRDVPLLR